jgi:quercetin dioxygenase-like cupin family protein
MLKKAYFSNPISEAKIVKNMKKEGFDSIFISDNPGFVYKKHQHSETKLLVCLEGSMIVEVDNKKYNFEPGDKSIIPGNTLHSAIVGDKGCTFFWTGSVRSY